MPQKRKSFQVIRILYIKQAVQPTTQTHTVKPFCPTRLTLQSACPTNQAIILPTEQNVKQTLHPAQTLETSSPSTKFKARMESRSNKPSVRPYTCTNRCNEKKRAASQERRNAASNRAVTTLPPMQQRVNTADGSRQSHPPVEQRKQVFLYARRCGRQEVCEVRNSEWCRRTRVGVCKQCKETDTCRENRTFV